MFFHTVAPFCKAPLIDGAFETEFSNWITKSSIGGKSLRYLCESEFRKSLAL